MNQEIKLLRNYVDTILPSVNDDFKARLEVLMTGIKNIGTGGLFQTRFQEECAIEQITLTHKFLDSLGFEGGFSAKSESFSLKALNDLAKVKKSWILYRLKYDAKIHEDQEWVTLGKSITESKDPIVAFEMTRSKFYLYPAKELYLRLISYLVDKINIRRFIIEDKMLSLAEGDNSDKDKLTKGDGGFLTLWGYFPGNEDDKLGNILKKIAGVDTIAKCEKNLIGVILLNRVVHEPVVYQNHALFEGGIDTVGGVSEKFVEQHRTVIGICDLKCKNRGLGNNKWDQRIIHNSFLAPKTASGASGSPLPVSKTASGASGSPLPATKYTRYLVLESLDGSEYHTLTPWKLNENSSAFVGTRYVKSLIACLKRENQKATRYHFIKSKKIFENVFTRFPINMEQILLSSKLEDYKYLRAQVYSDIFREYQKKPLSLSAATHSTRYAQLFINGLTTRFQKNVSTKITSDYSEIIMSFLPQLNYLSNKYSREMHDNYIKSPNEKFENVLDTVLKRIINNRTNVYESMLAKFHKLSSVKKTEWVDVI
jgi:hypothetical protein